MDEWFRARKKKLAIRFQNWSRNSLCSFHINAIAIIFFITIKMNVVFDKIMWPC